MTNEIYRNQTRLSGHSRQANRLSNSSEPAVCRRKPVSAACRNKINTLKESLTKQLAERYGNSLSATLVRQAVQEADALAAATLYPDLLLPVLAEEKVRSAWLWSKRQARIHQETISFAT